mgnify:FL=1
MILKTIKLLCLALLLTATDNIAQERIKKSINSNWNFHKGEIEGFPNKKADTNWKKIYN